MTRSVCSTLLVMCALCSPLAAQTAADPFTVPDILKGNVAFWKKIYTEVSLKDGLFHDRDYPMVIYRKATVGRRSGRSRKKFLRSHIAQIEVMLQSIATRPDAELTKEEKRIKALLVANVPESDRADAADRIRFQQGQKERFMEGIERSGLYLDTIRTILKSHGVPLRLAYLPHVESSFDVKAYSKVGAAGLWQFMRYTGRSYGLNSNYLIDDRRDPVKASDAAARLLAYNYSQLKSWPLAITAYNHGLAGMKRAVASTGSRDIAVIIQKHTSRTFKFASKNFYGCFLAASEIADKPHEYFDVVAYHDRLRWTDVTLTHYVRPSVLSRYLDVSKHVIQRYNPSLRPVVFQADKLIPAGHVLHLPVTVTAKQARTALASIPDSLRSDEPERPSYYRVRRGDNLYGIAHRLGVSARDIALANNITRMNRIYAGQVLQVPGGNKRTPARPATPTVAATRTASPAADTAAPAAAPPPTVDTASTAAELPDTLAEIIMATADTVAPASPRGRPSRMSRFDIEVYGLETTLVSPTMAEIRVAVNETIGHYADWLGVPTWQVRRLNHMGRRSSIRVGQALLIPLEQDDALERFAKVRLEYHMMLEEDFYSRFKIADVKARRIRRGENLWDICNAEGELPLWLFKKHNKHIDFDRLIPGMITWLPVVEEKTAEDLAFEQLEDSGIYPAFYEPMRTAGGKARLVP